jgi:uncharacterized protein
MNTPVAPSTRTAAQNIGSSGPISAPRRALLSLVLVLPLLLVATLPARALDVPYLSGRVVDQAGMLRASTVADIEQRLKAYEDSTGNQVAVLLIATLDGESLEDYSMRVVETWKLGKKGTDNGVLLLVARDDRMLRIEVGYGLEASLTDALCSYIINSVITPRFKDGDMDAGILDGVDAIMQGADGTLAVSESSSSSSSGDNMSVTEALLFSAFWFSIVGLFTLFAIISDGCSGWFLYAFLIPFYIGGAFVLSMGIGDVALALIPIYIIGLPILRWLFLKSPYSAALKKKLKYSSTGARTSIMGMTFTSSSGSSSGGGWSSGGGGFSGGGGSFGGGGSSGSW